MWLLSYSNHPQLFRDPLSACDFVTKKEEERIQQSGMAPLDFIDNGLRYKSILTRAV